tara:strand:- start:868 stop:2259 length:1392 start_codon:yes stop_codon:yes gene_type:complete
MTRKVIILDTNVLLHDPESIFHFANDNVIIPIQVVEEIDRFKKDPSEKGRNARRVSRLLDSLREKGNLSNGVKIHEEFSGVIRVDFCREETASKLPSELRNDSGDNKILAVALEQKNQKVLSDPPDVLLISQDTNLRIKADAIGIKAENYINDQIKLDSIPNGIRELISSSDEIKKIQKDRFLELHDIKSSITPNLIANEGVILRDVSKANHTYLCRYHAKKNRLIGLNFLKRANLGKIKPKNLEQSFALELLLDPGINLVSLVGKAGTGKTLLALAVGLHQVADENIYERMLVSRPPISLGKEVGFLPGSLDEKLAPWMKPIIDNLDFLTGSKSNKFGHNSNQKERQDNVGNSWEDLKGMGILEVEAINYIRGRSIPHQFILIDEAQNLTPLEVKTIVTRAGEGTKIVFTGDPNQIDQPYLDSDSNGLTWVAKKLQNQNIVGHITLSQGERSELAELAANIL